MWAVWVFEVAVQVSEGVGWAPTTHLGRGRFLLRNAVLGATSSRWRGRLSCRVWLAATGGRGFEMFAFGDCIGSVKPREVNWVRPSMQRARRCHAGRRGVAPFHALGAPLRPG